MDRLRRALDLALAERDLPVDVAAKATWKASEVRSSGEPPSQGGIASPRDPRPFIPKVVTLLPTAIEYTSTRVFDAATDLLESNRIIEPHAGGSSMSRPTTAAYRMLRTQVLQRMQERGWKSLAIMSPGSSDGKTTTAINLAVSLAGDHRYTVLLVDFDLRRPTIASRFGLTPKAGTDDILRGEAAVEDCLYHPRGFDRLVLLPARAAMANSSEALSGPRGRDLVSQLRARYSDRLLVFDLPPILGADDALAFAPQVECVLMVVAEGATQRNDLLRSMELLRQTPVVGTVLNIATNVASAYG